MASTAATATGKDALATTLYVQHLDSRNRERPLDTTPSFYTIGMSTPVQRAGSVQVSDVALPTEVLTGVDASRYTFQVSEPLRFHSASTLTMQETQTVYNIATGVVQSTTPLSAVVVNFPATLTPVASVSSNTVTTSSNHNLNTVFTLWPPTVTPAMFVGSRVRDLDPAITPSVVTGTSSNTFTLSSSAVSAMLAKTAGPLANLAATLVGASANAYVYVTPLTIPEWVTLLNTAFATLLSLGQLTMPYKIAINDATGLIELSVTGTDVLTTTTRTETTTTFTVNVLTGDPLYRLGFKAGTWTLTRFAGGNGASATSTSRFDSRGRRLNSTPFVTAVLARDARTIAVPPATYSAADLATALTAASNGLYIPTSASATVATLAYTDATGVSRTLLVPSGKYTPSQMATFLQTNMNLSPTIDGHFSVATTTAGTNGFPGIGFTIADTLGRPFSLDFSGDAGRLLGPMLGYELLLYSGSSSYTSTLQGVCGTGGAGGPQATIMRRNLMWVANDARSRLIVSSPPPIPSYEGTVTSGATAANTHNVTTTELDSSGATNVATGAATDDVLRFSDGSHSVSAVVVATPTGNASSSPVQVLSVDFGAALLGTDIVITGIQTVTPESRPALVLHMGRPPYTARFLDEDNTGAGLVNAMIGSAATGTGAAYGPIAEVLGFDSTTYQADTGMMAAPNAYSLDPWPYIMLVLLAPTSTSDRARHRVLFSQEEVVVLAKCIITNGYARISTELTTAHFTSLSVVQSVKLAWVAPDGSLVDWQGVNHSLALFFRTAEGSVEGAGPL